jgi:hypothetical protein
MRAQDESRSQEGGRAGLTQLIPLYTIAACVVWLTVGHFRPAQASGGRSGSELQQFPLPDSLYAHGHWEGSPQAPVRVVVFSDLQCPACRRLALQYIPALRDKYGDSVSFLHRHWPLENHRLALPAARAVECAAYQDRFQPMFEQVLRNQSALGDTELAVFAKDAGVPDLDRFSACVANAEVDSAIERDREAALALESFGTPTVVVNGWYARAGFSPSGLDSLVSDVLAGRRPDSRR